MERAIASLKTRAAVLCGGEGKRLSPLTNYFQKTMIPIGARKEPLLEYVVKLLVHHKIEDITMLTGYRAEEIENYFRDGKRLRAKINYSRDPINGAGSAGALAHAISSDKIGPCDDIVVYYGDILSDIDMTEMLRVHRLSRALATLVISKGFTLPVGVADIEKNIVKSFVEKPKYDINVTTGNMIINKKAVPHLYRLMRKKPKADLMKDFITSLLAEKEKIAAYTVNGFWYDVGTVDKYLGLSDSLIEKHLGFLDE